MEPMVCLPQLEKEKDMAIRTRFNVQVALVFALCMAISAFAHAQALENVDTAGLEKLKSLHGNFSLTILPIVIPEVMVELEQRVEFSKGLAVALERTGLKTIVISLDNFGGFSADSSALKSIDGLEKALQAYLKDHSPGTDYVYCMEYIGKPQKLAEAIFTIVATPKGEIVWKLQQNSKDPTFSQISPNSVFAGVLTSAEPFRQLLGLADPTGPDVYTGKWAGYFEEKSKKKLAETAAVNAQKGQDANKPGNAASPAQAGANPAVQPAASNHMFIWVSVGVLVLLIAILGFRLASKKSGS
jgi:hypothetical protein